MTAPRTDPPNLRAELAALKERAAALRERFDPALVESIYQEEREALLNRYRTTPEQELAKMGGDAPEITPWGYTGMVANSVMAGIPGGQRLVAALRSARPDVTFKEALEDVRSSQDALPLSVKLAGGAAGGALGGGVLGKVAGGALGPALSPTKQAAAYGGAIEALSPEEMSAPERALRTGAGAATGAVAAKGMEVGANLARRLKLGAQALVPGGRAGVAPDELLHAQQQDLKAKVGPLYQEALEEGGGRAAPEPVRAVLDRPEVQDLLGRLRGLRKFEGLADDDPKMIDALYKALSDNLKQLKKGGAVQALSPEGRVTTNLGRFAADDIAQLQDDLLTALGLSSERTVPAVTTTAPGITTAQSPPPTLREAIRRFERQQAEVWRRNPGTETVAQRSARTALERHGAENIASPSLSGAPPGPRTVEVIPASTENVPPFMSKYADAVRTYAIGKGEQLATRRGADAINMTVAKRTSGANLGKKSPESLERWLREQASEGERRAFQRSVEGDLGLLVRKPPASIGDWAILPLISRAARGTAAADRMIRAAQHLPRTSQVPAGLSTSLLALLLGDK